MSPTLLELIVAIALVCLAWKIGVWLAPWVFRPFVTFWRDAKRPAEPTHWPPEKNVTPLAERAKHPQSSHGNVHK